MATATKSKSAIVERAPQTEVGVDVDVPSRREFLYYIWGASVVMLLGQVGAGLVWFGLPRFKEGEFGGVFHVGGNDIPEQGSVPVSVPAGRYWMSNTNDGFLALYAVCTHLGCLPKWNTGNVRFECPCHGSKFENTGKYIEGPAPRSMDRFVTTITFTNGDVETTPVDGGPIAINGRKIAEVAIDTGTRIQGEGH